MTMVSTSIKATGTVLAFLSSLCLFLSPLQGQEMVTGKVTEAGEQGKPLPFASVYWLGTQTGTTTDEDGKFELEISPETDRLVVSFIGFVSDTLKVTGNGPVLVSLTGHQTLKELEVAYRLKGTEISFMDPLKVENMGEKELFKAACCNLSESFETNPSIDVSFTDAVTGTKQIEMLGLAGPYTQITRELVPSVRGISSAYGLTFIPGTWVESIQVTKGVGPVTNGFESISGQINTELRKPYSMDRVFLNGYMSQSGRTELNLNLSQPVSKDWSTALLLHSSARPFSVDANEDGFLDFPSGRQINAINRWDFHGEKGLEGQIGFNALTDRATGGQDDDEFTNPYLVQVDNEKYEAWGKTGYVFPNALYRSIGFQWSVSQHEQDMEFGPNNYHGKQQTGYGNLIYQSIISNTAHQFKTGISFLYDRYDEQFNQRSYKREEIVPGAFFEYSFKYFDKFSVVPGVRLDYHNVYGLQFVPRLHARYAPTKTTVFRVSGGRGWRTASVLAENTSLMASSRTWNMVPSPGGFAYGLGPESAWNYGGNVLQNFRLWYREGYISADFYRTEFSNQVVIDRDHDPSQVLVYNLEGASYSNSVQLELSYEVVKFLDMRIAYRYLDVQTHYTRGWLQKPFTSQHRAFLNLAYETREQVNGSQWLFDATLQWFGSKRIPFTDSNPVEYRLPGSSPSFFTLNGQVTRHFSKRWDAYLGVENILNFTQKNPIVAAEDPFGPHFDSSMIWGPIFGRMVYAGFRFRISQ